MPTLHEYEDLIRENAQLAKEATQLTLQLIRYRQREEWRAGSRTTHSDACWRWHPSCAERKIAELDASLARLQAVFNVASNLIDCTRGSKYESWCWFDGQIGALRKAVEAASPPRHRPTAPPSHSWRIPEWEDLPEEDQRTLLVHLLQYAVDDVTWEDCLPWSQQDLDAALKYATKCKALAGDHRVRPGEMPDCLKQVQARIKAEAPIP